MSELIRYIFTLQLRRFSRKCADMGMHPLILISVSLIVFVIGSFYLFTKTDLAPWIYISISLVISHYYIDLNSYDHILHRRQIVIFKLFSHLLVGLPFVIFLLYKFQWIEALVLFLGQCCLVPLSNRSTYSFRIPTPFKKTPFEYIVGFRTTFPLILTAYFLAFKGIQVDNPNLAYSSIGILLLITTSFYFKMEDPYFVWIHAKKPSEFIKRKLSIAWINALKLTIPALVIIIPFYPSMWYIAVIIYGYGFIIITLFILAKYAAFPKEINFPQAIIMGLTFLLPLLIFYSIPLFYSKARQKLYTYL